jgi:hypothetical protein
MHVVSTYDIQGNSIYASTTMQLHCRLKIQHVTEGIDWSAVAQQLHTTAQALLACTQLKHWRFIQSTMHNRITLKLAVSTRMYWK